MFAINTVQYFGGQITSIRRGWSRVSENLCYLLCNALPAAAQGALESSSFHVWFVSFSLPQAVLPLHWQFLHHLPVVCSSNCGDVPKYQHTKGGTLTWKPLVLVASNKSPTPEQEVRESQDLAVVQGVPCIISHSCFMCMSSEVHRLTEWFSKLGARRFG